MRFPTLRRVFCAFSALLTTVSLGFAVTSSWVYYDTNGNLQYAADSNGNRILDYSSAGYAGGGVALPRVTAKATVSPSGGDDTTAIQTAINQVSALTPDSNGFRGAVLLAPGTFNVSATLKITTGGVVLAGSGSGDGGTSVNMGTTAGFPLVNFAGSGSYSKTGTVSMTDSYVPSGATSFNVSSASGFSVGDTIVISRPVTAAWVHLMGMDTLTRSGSPQTWISVGSEILTDRVIKAISGNRLTIDVPLTDSFDATYLNPPGGTVSKYTFAGRIAQVGIEHLKIIGAPTEQTGASYQAVTMNSVYNAWAQDILAQDTENSVSVDKNSKQVTVQNVRIAHTYAQTNSAAPADFTLSATQILAVNCFVTGTGNTWAYITAGAATGPAVVLDCYADDRGFSPHQRWYTGMLCDLCNFPHTSTSDKAGVGYSNRGNYGSGQGWDAGWSVAWNVTTQTLLVQEPPGAHNWCIGCTGTELSEAAPGSTTILPNGIYESLGTAVTPGSLYLAQLKQRLGASALTNIGYADTNGTAIPVATPTFSPAGGTYTAAQTVTLTSTTAGAAIRYTTNGTTPTSTTGTLYTGPITVSASQTIKAIAYEGGMTDSAVGSAVYTISGTTPAKFTIPASSVTASAYTSSYVPANTVDGSLSTRWAGNGDGVWIRYDLGATKTVSYVKLAWYLGTSRTYTFDVQLSTNGSTWTTVISRKTSSGSTTALETYDFADASARYVRIVGHLSSADAYTNITEAEVWGF